MGFSNIVKFLEIENIVLITKKTLFTKWEINMANEQKTNPQENSLNLNDLLDDEKTD